MFDLEGHLTDVKDHDYALLTGVRPAGDPVHDMWARLTVGRDYIVRAIEVRTDGMPYQGACDRIESMFAELDAGVRIDQALEVFSAKHSLPPGFGHTIYPAGDPRAALLKRVAKMTAKV